MAKIRPNVDYIGTFWLISFANLLRHIVSGFYIHSSPIIPWYDEGLRLGMEQLVHLQQNHPIMDVCPGAFKKKMKVHFVISLIVGDQESSDKIIARMPPHKNAV